MQNAVISRATSGAGTAVVAAQAGKRIYVYGYVIMSAGTVGAKFESGDGSTQTALSGLFPLAAQAGVSFPLGHEPCFSLPPGKALYLNLDAAIGVYGHVAYAVR